MSDDLHPIVEAILNCDHGPYYTTVGAREDDPDHDCNTCTADGCDCPGWCCNITLTHEVHGLHTLILTAELPEIAEEVCRAANVAWGAAVVGAFGDAKLHGPGIAVRGWGAGEARRHRERSAGEAA